MAAGRRAIRFSVAFLALLAFPPSISAQQALTQIEAEQEAFLKRAKVVRTRGAAKGVTATLRATLSDGTMTHDAQIQTIDQHQQVFQSGNVVELNFRDSWRYNVAAYRLNKVLRLGRIPPSIERVYNGKRGAFTWWIDDVMMEEADRLKTKTEVPDTEAWNRQMWHVRIFDQLIYNVDRNLGNLLIDKGWNVWMIDHTRAFRTIDTSKAPQDLKKIERGALERLKKLDAPSLKALTADYLSPEEQKRLLTRRDAIVKLFEQQGEAALFDAFTTDQPLLRSQARF
jgi:hypothetical protein